MKVNATLQSEGNTKSCIESKEQTTEMQSHRDFLRLFRRVLRDLVVNFCTKPPRNNYESMNGTPGDIRFC